LSEGDLRNLVEGVVRSVDEFLKIKDEVREYMIKHSRDIIREAGYVITDIHRGDVKSANNRLVRLREYVREFLSRLKEHPELLYSGTVYSALSEYVEAEVFHSIIESMSISDYKSLNIHPIPYIQGLLDVIGELKRYIINLVRSKDLTKAWRLFRVAEAIYESCKGLDYPEALVPGLRRKVDIARNVIESLRVFLTDIETRLELIGSINKLKK